MFSVMNAVDAFLFQNLSQVQPFSTANPTSHSTLECPSPNVLEFQRDGLGNQAPALSFVGHTSSEADPRFPFYDCHTDFMTAGLLDNYPQLLGDSCSSSTSSPCSSPLQQFELPEQQLQYQQLEQAYTNQLQLQMNFTPSKPIQIPTSQQHQMNSSQLQPDNLHQFFLPHFSHAHIPSVPEYSLRSEHQIDPQNQHTIDPLFKLAHLTLEKTHLGSPMNEGPTSETGSCGSLSPIPSQDSFDCLPMEGGSSSTSSPVGGYLGLPVVPGLLSSSAPQQVTQIGFDGFMTDSPVVMSSSMPLNFGSTLPTLPLSYEKDNIAGPSLISDSDVSRRESSKTQALQDDDEDPIDATMEGVVESQVATQGFSVSADTGSNSNDTPARPKLKLACTYRGCMVTCSSYPSLQRHCATHKWRGRYSPVRCEACQSCLSNEFSVQRHILRSPSTSRCQRMSVYSIMQGLADVKYTVRFHPGRGHGKKTERVNLEHMKMLY
ncbi:hypothetical protein BG004_003835 [Podila humilis]|nr:hypothetical protein BG004_003835 [Podila humilis]